jgi:SAM-dependent methyltransferase
MNSIIASLPEWAIKPLKRFRDTVKRVPYYGKGRFCPVCGKSSSRFRPFGVVPRKDAQCTYCGALERHRFLWIYISSKTNLFDRTPKKMLHVAPEACLEPKFAKQLGENYLTADLLNPHVMVKMDITNIRYPDGSFDVIYCSHVLEHVLEDRKAMREFYRVLKSNGWAILLVPINEPVKTYEDSSIEAPLDRLKAFGQEDHVRSYGPDYVDRLREAGFKVKITKVDDCVQKDEAILMGLTPASGHIYYCTK